MQLPIVFAVLAALVYPGAVPAAETVIVNPKTSSTSLNEDEVKDLFLGKRTTWPDGSKVVVVVLKDGASHGALMKLLGKSSAQFSTGWKKLVFTGKGSMPEQVDSEDALIDFVIRNPGAIAFVDAGKVKDGVKAVPLGK